VVSMGSYAASGGYWITTASDEVWASPNTVTGSIGIFGYFPTFQKPLAKYLGVRVDGVGTTWLSGVRSERELPGEMKTAFELMIRQGYQDFLERVGEAREMSLEEVHEMAQGRVWMGSQAKELGLVDELGGLSDAVASAARRAGLDEDYGVRYLEQELSFEENLMISMLSRVHAALGPALGPVLKARHPVSLRGSVASAMGRFFEREMATFSQFQDPRGIYAHCLCEVD
jgi:protease-4